VAVVPEPLAFRDDDPITGENNRRLHVAVVGEGQGARLIAPEDDAAFHAVLRIEAQADRRSAGFRTRRALERTPEILLAREGFLGGAFFRASRAFSGFH